MNTASTSGVSGGSCKQVNPAQGHFPFATTKLPEYSLLWCYQPDDICAGLQAVNVNTVFIIAFSYFISE